MITPNRDSNAKTLVYWFLASQGISLNEKSSQVMENFMKLCRIFDNLLDEQKFPHRILEKKIQDQGFISEWDDFLWSISEQQRKDTERNAQLALRIMGIYNNTHSFYWRCMEGKILARFFIDLLGSDKYEWDRRALEHFMIAWYAFSDLQDYKEDGRKALELLELFLNWLKRDYTFI